MNNNDTTDIITENKWFRLYPKCGQSIIFSSKFSCEASYGINPLCVECASPKSPGGQRKRRCNKTAKIICEDNDGFIANNIFKCVVEKMSNVAQTNLP